MTHVVALSGGKDSTAMALVLRERYPDIDYTYICTPTGDELPEMFEHWRKLSGLLGKTIVPVMNPLGLGGLIRKEKALPNFRMRFCTVKLKLEPYAAWLAQHVPCVSYVGLRADEEEREGGDYRNVPGVEQRYPLREWGWELADVLGYLASKSIAIPDRTDCARCFYQQLPEWRNLWQQHPDLYEDAVQDEKMIGATYRSPGRDTWPADLEGLRAEFQRGRTMRGDEQRLQIPMFDTALAEAKCRVCRL